MLIGICDRVSKFHNNTLACMAFLIVGLQRSMISANLIFLLKIQTHNPELTCNSRQDTPEQQKDFRLIAQGWSTVCSLPSILVGTSPCRPVWQLTLY